MQSKFTLICFILLSILCFDTEAQDSYSFSRIPPGSISYQELLADSDVTHFADSVGYFPIDAPLYGEVFPLYGGNDTMGVNAYLFLGDNGFMEIDDITTSIAAIFDAGFTLMTTIDSTSKMSYQIDGVSGNLIVKLQFKNWKLTNGPAGNYSNYQIWFHQQTGVIEFRYGGRSANNVSGYTVSNGPNVGAFLTPFNFSGCIEKLWCNGQPNNPTLDSTANYAFAALQGLPDSGTIYRFTPQFAVGINEQQYENQTLQLFPSVADKTIFVEMKDAANAMREAAVFDMVGRTVKTIQITPGLNEINISDLNTGLYFVNITGEKQVKKFIKIN